MNTAEVGKPAVLVAAVLGRDNRTECEAHLRELELLAASVGFRTRARVIQDRGRPDAATLLGRGKLEEVARAVRDTGSQRVFFDADLTPGQVANLEKAFKVPVVDRAGLILDLFASRARSREARTQVELASLRYLLPRLTRRWTHLSRQEGGIGVRGGGGETQIESDRRMVRRRIAHLERDLTRIGERRRVRRRARMRFFSVALVGYTNSGKSSLFNALTDAGARVEDRLFATLDPLARRLAGPDGEGTIVSDTVGFIRKLPHHLIASFRSTLEEAGEADLLLHVVDTADPAQEEQMSTTVAVLEDLGLGGHPHLLVFNKIDRPEASERRAVLGRRHPEAVFVSSLTGEGLDTLQARLAEHRAAGEIDAEAELQAGDTAALAALHRHARVLGVTGENGVLRVRYRARREAAARIERALQEASHV